MKKSIMSLLPEAAMLMFAGRKRVTKGSWTIKYYFAKVDKAIRYCVYKGKGTGSQQYSTLDFDKAIEFCTVEPVYRNIVSLTGGTGGAYFYRDSQTMFDQEHPFFEAGFCLTDSDNAIVTWETTLKNHAHKTGTK